MTISFIARNGYDAFELFPGSKNVLAGLGWLRPTATADVLICAGIAFALPFI